MNCNHCNHEINHNYCPNCGQPAKLKRINGHYIIHEIEHEFHFEKGLLFTIKELLIRPGENVRRFLNKDRTRLVKPIIFIILTSLIYSLVIHFFNIKEGYENLDGDKTSTVNLIFNWIKDHYGYSNIIMGLFIALWLKLFFRKYDYNFYEILILLCYVMGMAMFIMAVFALIQGLTKIKFDLLQASGYLLFVYSSWVIGQFYDKTKPVNYLKALISYIFGVITFWLFALLLGFIIDSIIKH